MSDELQFDWREMPGGYWAAECSPRGDYRLVVMAQRPPLDPLVTMVEWLTGGSEWIGTYHALESAKTDAEKWAREYEAQE